MLNHVDLMSDYTILIYMILVSYLIFKFMAASNLTHLI